MSPCETLGLGFALCSQNCFLFGSSLGGFLEPAESQGVSTAGCLAEVYLPVVYRPAIIIPLLLSEIVDSRHGVILCRAVWRNGPHTTSVTSHMVFGTKLHTSDSVLSPFEGFGVLVFITVNECL